MISVKMTGQQSVINTINKFARNMSNDIQQLNTERATKFRKKTIELTKAGQLGLAEIDEKTRRNRKSDKGGPLYDLGDLLEGQKVHEEKDKSTEVGYFDNDTERHPDTNLTNADLALIHTVGSYTPGGKPRPFMHNSAFRWERSDEDEKITKKFIKKEMAKSGV